MEDMISPIILPKKQHITKLIMLHYHQNVCCHYGGINYLLSRVREKFWPISGYSEARMILTTCTICKVKKPGKPVQQMSSLPELRLPLDKDNQVAPYYRTATDYAGPFITQAGRGKSRTKRWLCLFTCLSCRAVHLEIVYNLTTESFLQAFQRFIARNARPRHMYLDNMTTFIKAESDIRKWLNSNKSDLISKAQKSYPDIEFHFIPPMSPNYGGAWESMIKLAKRGFYDVIKPGIINDEELITAFTIVEGLLNSRPLSTLSSDPDDLQVLTPAHFLVRDVYRKIAPFPENWSEKQRYLHIQDIMSNMWTRFMKELVPLKHKFEKNAKKTESFQVGDVVVLLNELDREVSWPIAVIKETHESHDGVIRKATLTFNGKDYVRSNNHFTKLRFFNW